MNCADCPWKKACDNTVWGLRGNASVVLLCPECGKLYIGDKDRSMAKIDVLSCEKHNLKTLEKQHPEALLEYRAKKEDLGDLVALWVHETKEYSVALCPLCMVAFPEGTRKTEVRDLDEGTTEWVGGKS